MSEALKKRRAATAVVAVICFTLLLGMAALSIDLGYMYNRHTEMQNAVDAGALGGASGLPTSNDEARARAIQTTQSNYLGPEAIVVNEEDVDVGNWEWESQTFTPVSDDDWSGIQPNAVRVVGRKLNLQLIFAPILGFDTTDVVRQAIALLDSGRCRGVWGLQGIVANGDVITDSYDSRQGMYGPGNIRPNGDLCSNEDIIINGGVSVRGDAMYGYGWELSIAGISHEIWGIAAEASGAGEPPNVDPSEARLNNDNDMIGTNRDGLTDDGHEAAARGNLSLESDDNVTLWGGTYHFDSVRLLGQATITIAGPTVIYVEGNATFTGGGLVNVTQNPRNLVIYCTGKTLKVGGGSAFHGAVVAPETDVTLFGTVEYFGTVIGQTVTTIGNSVIHVDEALVADLLGGDRAESPILVK